MPGTCDPGKRDEAPYAAADDRRRAFPPRPVRESRNGLALAAKHRYHIGLEGFAAIEITGVPAPQLEAW